MIEITDGTGYSVEITIDELREVNAALHMIVAGFRRMAELPAHAGRRVQLLTHADELQALNVKLAELPR